MLSQTSQYALRTVLQLARLPEGARGSAGELARQMGAPANYLSKTLHQLARAGVVSSTRGKHGGFVLARAPHRITLAEVVAPFQDMGERTLSAGAPPAAMPGPPRARPLEDGGPAGGGLLLRDHHRRSPGRGREESFTTFSRCIRHGAVDWAGSVGPARTTRTTRATR